jgi:hypothetical protein
VTVFKGLGHYVFEGLGWVAGNVAEQNHNNEKCDKSASGYMECDIALFGIMEKTI